MKKCNAVRCQQKTEHFFLFCKEHWALLPLQLRDDVNESYRVRQRDPGRYLRAVKRAITLVMEKEKDDARPNHARLLSGVD